MGGMMKRVSLRNIVYSDIDILYEWANDPETRTNAFSTDPIPYNVHKEWFNKKINAKSVAFYMCVEKTDVNEVCIGQIRIDINDNYGIINYSISSLFRKQGYGTYMITLVEKQIKNDNPLVKRLIADVKYQNEASQHIFRKLNYEESFQKGFIRFSKKI
jgi:RimJ/RimL family protein N-acetyltransferase